jgi:UDP-3-O-[3-hydroxymyristoyl] glucosamine N-acyltransferase
MTIPNISPLAAERISNASLGFAMEGRMPASRGRCGLTIAELAKLTGAALAPGAPPERRVGYIASLATAGAADLTYVDDDKYLDELAATRAGACLMSPRFATLVPPQVAALLTDEPYRAFVTAMRALFPDALRPSSLFETRGRAATAHVHASARIEAGVTLDPLAVIGPCAEVGAGTLIAVGAALGPGVCIGRHCAVGAGATIMKALIGDRVIIGAGVRLGQDGSGYLREGRELRKIPHARRVILQDDVEIGANATIDRGATRDTVIGEGAKIGNLVQIAHSARIGRHCLIAAHAAIAGGATVGDFVTIGARVDIAANVTIANGAKLDQFSMIGSDVPAGGELRR